jgi:hypothetical protein
LRIISNSLRDPHFLVCLNLYILKSRCD